MVAPPVLIAGGYTADPLSMYTILTLQCCRALLQPLGGVGLVMVMVTCSGSFHIYFCVAVKCSPAVGSSAPAPHICIQSTIDVARQKFLITSNIDNLSFPLKQQRH